MTEESSLIVIAEVAAALAGFSGVAATFGRRQERPWSDEERERLANLLNHSGIALFAATQVRTETSSPTTWSLVEC